MIRASNTFSSAIGAHCKGVKGLGMKGLTERVIEPSRPLRLLDRQPCLADAAGQRQAVPQCRHPLRRQADEEIELQIRNSFFGQQAHSRQDLFLRHPLVDQVAQALAAGFRSEGDGL